MFKDRSEVQNDLLKTTRGQSLVIRKQYQLVLFLFSRTRLFIKNMCTSVLSLKIKTISISTKNQIFGGKIVVNLCGKIDILLQKIG